MKHYQHKTTSASGNITASNNAAAGLSPVTYIAVLAAGLLTSLSPCTLSVLPLTIGYIGGYSDAGSSSQSAPLVGR